MRRDGALAIAGLALACAVWVAADALPRSLLADGVGADGLPKTLAVLLAALSIAIGARAVRAQETAGAPAFERKGLVVLGAGAAYLVLLPWLGYPLAIALALAAMGLLYGAPATPRNALLAVGGAATLWLVFAGMLGIPMPAGRLFGF